jgi:hypothetical protein
LAVVAAVPVWTFAAPRPAFALDDAAADAEALAATLADAELAVACGAELTALAVDAALAAAAVFAALVALLGAGLGAFFGTWAVCWVCAGLGIGSAVDSCLDCASKITGAGKGFGVWGNGTSFVCCAVACGA